MRNVLLIFLLFCCAFLAPAQNLVDLYDPIYQDLQQWQGAGYIDFLPNLQPWPAQRVVTSLRQLLDNPRVPVADKARATRYLNYLGSESAQFKPMAFFNHRHEFGSDPESRTILGPGLDLDWNIHPLVSLSASGNPTFIDHTNGIALPAYRRESIDWVPDWSDFDAFGRNILVQTRVTSLLTLGTDSLWFSTGIGRTNFGPFYDDGIVISRNAPYGSHYSFTWHQPQFTFSMLYRPLTASRNTGAGLEPDKHMVFHSLDYRPFPWITFSFYESLVWGQRFDLNYFVPFNSFFLAQGIGGFEGNSLLGVGGELKPVPGLIMPLTIYADDVHFNDIVRREWDTKYKIALQLGAHWHPGAQDIPVLEFLGADYTAVMPYMYSHWDENPQNGSSWLSAFNYSNYTHLGSSIATSLRPNSDRFQIMARTRPLAWLSVNIHTQVSRHGNASEGIIENASGTGTIFDPGYIGNRPTFQRPFVDPTGQPYTRFLTQDILETTWQFGTELTFDGRELLPLNRADLLLGYTFEYVRNYDLVQDDNRTRHFFRVETKVRY